MSVNNIDKILQYIRLLSKDPIILDGQSYEVYRSHIMIGKGFFLADRCDSCGGCDVFEDNLFTESEYQKIANMSDEEWSSLGFKPADLAILKGGIIPEKHTINGKEIQVYVYPQTAQIAKIPYREKPLERCEWMYYNEEHDKFFCRIHPVTSITCKMPHFRIFYNSRSGSISLNISQFGRNWMLGCPVTFHEPVDEAEFNEAKESRIGKLKILEQVANDLGIETYIPVLLKYIDETTFYNYKNRVGKVVVEFSKFKKLF